jgi:hypothetical protein
MLEGSCRCNESVWLVVATINEICRKQCREYYLQTNNVLQKLFPEPIFPPRHTIHLFNTPNGV